MLSELLSVFSFEWLYPRFAVSPDANLVACASINKSNQDCVTVWRRHCPESGKSFALNSLAKSVGFSEDCKKLIVCDLRNRSVSIWNVSTESPDVTRSYCESTAPSPLELKLGTLAVFRSGEVLNVVGIEMFTGQVWAFSGFSARPVPIESLTECIHVDILGDYILAVTYTEVRLYNLKQDRILFTEKISTPSVFSCRLLEIRKDSLQMAIVTEKITFLDWKPGLQTPRTTDSIDLTHTLYPYKCHFIPGTPWAMVIAIRKYHTWSNNRCVLYNRKCPASQAIKWERNLSESADTIQFDYHQSDDDELKILVGERNGSLHLISVRGDEVASCNCQVINTGILYALRIGSTRLLYGMYGGDIVQMDHDFKEIHRFTHPMLNSGRLIALAYSPDERFILSTGEVTLTLWDQSGCPLRTIYLNHDYTQVHWLTEVFVDWAGKTLDPAFPDIVIVASTEEFELVILRRFDQHRAIDSVEEPRDSKRTCDSDSSKQENKKPKL